MGKNYILTQKYLAPRIRILMNLRNPNLWDILSLTVSIFTYVPLVLATILDSWKYELITFLGAMTTMTLSEAIKKHLIGSAKSWMKRPAAAYDCNAFCNDGAQGGKPGFPSTHSAITTFLAARYTSKPELSQLAQYSIIVLWGLILYSRIAKSCHTWLQVGAGTAFGALIYFISTKADIALM